MNSFNCKKPETINAKKKEYDPACGDDEFGHVVKIMDEVKQVPESPIIGSPRTWFFKPFGGLRI